MVWSRNKLTLYSIAFAIRLLLAPFFVDKLDSFVFLEVARDVVLYDRGIYFEGVLHSKFNYFPLAYLAVLPGLFLYYSYLPPNLYLERILLKLPFMLGDLYLAHQVSKMDFNLEGDDIPGKIATGITGLKNYELFILFNPFLIFISSIKGQFDIIPAIFIFFSFRSFRNSEYLKSGFFIGISILFKQYGLIINAFLGLYVLFQGKRETFNYIVGFFLSVFPVILFGALMNLNGMIQHALLFHINRIPSGLSVTALLYYVTYFGFRYMDLPTVADSFSSFILSTSVIILLSSLLVLAAKFYYSDRSYGILTKYMFYGFVFSILLNKVFYFQYLVPFFVIAIEYMYTQKKLFSDTQFAWEFSIIPFAVMYRVIDQTPGDTRALFGEYWLYVLWAIILVIHLIIMITSIKLGMKPLRNKKLKILYGFIMLLYLANLIIQQLLGEFWSSIGALNNLVGT